MKLQIDYREEKVLKFKFFFFKNCRANKIDTEWIHIITTLGSSQKQREKWYLSGAGDVETGELFTQGHNIIQHE